MNHIGAKTEVTQTAWDQLAQTQNYDHPIRGTTQTTTTPQAPPTPPPKAPIINNNQTTANNDNKQPPPTAPTQQQPEYGEELHPELVS